MRLKIEKKSDILRFTILGTALAVIVPVIVIAALLLNAMFVLQQTIERIDSHVKFDGLTGILNRSHFLDSVRATRVDGMMLIVDVDHFKSVNDDLGHDAGDEVLKVLASRIAVAVGADGLVGRLGGEEFAVFLPEQTHDHAAQKAAAICEHIRKSFVPVGDIRLKTTVSIGGALHHESAPLGHALKLADQRLYQAKSGGRDSYVIMEPTPVVTQPTKLRTVSG